MSAYEQGLDAGRKALASALNPYPDHFQAHDEWDRGWLRGAAERVCPKPRPMPKGPALIHPIGCMTAAQLELLCRREGFALGRIGRERFVLVQTARPQTMLRIAATTDKESA